LGEPWGRILTAEDQCPDAEMGFPVSKASFDRHALGIEIHDLLGGQRDISRDQKIPSLLFRISLKRTGEIEGKGLYQVSGLLMPSFFIRERRVLGFIPRS